MRALSEMIVGATLLQAGVFAVFLLSDRFRGSLANFFLCASLFVMVAILNSVGDHKDDLAGSVRVAVGDRVSQGEVIGAVGDTEDSAAVHLHFQVNAGPDAFFSPSIPVRFDDMEGTFIGADPGVYVRKAEKSAD